MKFGLPRRIAIDGRPRLLACAHVGCDRPRFTSGSLWCSGHGVAFDGDKGLLEPLFDDEGRIVGDYRGVIKPEILAALCPR